MTYAAILLFGTAWMGSSFLESPAIGTSVGIGAPIALLIVLSVLQYYTGNDAFELGWWYNAMCTILGIACFITGTVHYLRRIEP